MVYKGTLEERRAKMAKQRRTYYANNEADRLKISIRSANRRIARKQKLNEIKLANGCTDCGYNSHPEALQFDHVMPKHPLFKAGVGGGFSRNLSRNWDFIMAEIAKCEIVCANCHAVRTANRRIIERGVA